MPRSKSPQISRRDVLISPLSIPLIGTSHAQGNISPTTRIGDQRDPVVTMAAAWIMKRQVLEEMIYEWQRQEKQLFKKAKLLNVMIDDACGPRFPEAAVMKALDRRMDRTYDVLETMAQNASRLPAITAEGALAKIDLGLRVQGRYQWQPNALELIECGVQELAELHSR